MVDDKKLKKVIKEGGKRGVEIEGAASMGGLSFFCTKVDEPEGDVELLLESVKAMNTEVDETEEERRGGSGEIGKMIFSSNDDRVAVVAYVPTAFKDQIDAKTWLETVVASFEGKYLSGDGNLSAGEIPANPAAGRFTLKMRDEALTKSIEYLRSLKLFPEASNDDSDDDVVFGDDFDFDGC